MSDPHDEDRERRALLLIASALDIPVEMFLSYATSTEAILSEADQEAQLLGQFRKINGIRARQQGLRFIRALAEQTTSFER